MAAYVAPREADGGLVAPPTPGVSIAPQQCVEDLRSSLQGEKAHEQPAPVDDVCLRRLDFHADVAGEFAEAFGMPVPWLASSMVA